MIVPMKKVTLLAVEDERNRALGVLRSLGVMQIDAVRRNASESSGRIADDLEIARRAERMLDTFASETGRRDKSSRCAGAEAVERLTELFDRRNKLSAERGEIARARRRLACWGEFDRHTIEELRGNGVYVYLCVGSEREFQRVAAMPELACRLIRSESGKFYFAAFATAPQPEGSLPEFQFGAGDDPAELLRRDRRLADEEELVNDALVGLINSQEELKKRVVALEGELEFSRAADALGEHDAVVSLRGFVPEPELPRLLAAAKTEGWGLLAEDPAADDLPPTELKLSKFAQTIAPLFGFLGIFPGYRELDASVGVLVFFCIFCAMIIGDGGYGALLTVATLLAAWKFRGNPRAKLPVRLFLVIGVSTLLWGLITGNFFGVAPQWLEWAQIPALASSSIKDKNVQCLCFVLAVAQLSLGHIWRAAVEGNLKAVLRNLGWMLILWGNFFLTIRLLVYPGDFPVYMYWFYGVGLLLVVLFGVNWRDIADVFQFPFSVINSFVDILSYIRLFAVGMAGYYIAVSFNDMGKELCDFGWWAVLFGVLVVLLGHTLNIVLCGMSVLVHAIRLNTLEFSSHIGLQWGGVEFKPFKDKTED